MKGRSRVFSNKSPSNDFNKNIAGEYANKEKQLHEMQLLINLFF